MIEFEAGPTMQRHAQDAIGASEHRAEPFLLLVHCLLSDEDTRTTVAGLDMHTHTGRMHALDLCECYLSIYPSIYPYVHPSMHLYIYPSIHPAIYLSIYCVTNDGDDDDNDDDDDDDLEVATACVLQLLSCLVKCSDRGNLRRTLMREEEVDRHLWRSGLELDGHLAAPFANNGHRTAGLGVQQVLPQLLLLGLQLDLPADASLNGLFLRSSTRAAAPPLLALHEVDVQIPKDFVVRHLQRGAIMQGLVELRAGLHQSRVID